MPLPKQRQMGVGVLKAVDSAIEADWWPPRVFFESAAYEEVCNIVTGLKLGAYALR